MKEFYIYTLKKAYIGEFGRIEPHLANPEFKALTRPMVCIKDSKTKQCWLIPMTSLNPYKENYASKVQTVSYRESLETDLEIKAQMRCRTITGLQCQANYEDVLLFYQAIPVKHFYVAPYINHNKHVAATFSPEEQQVIRSNLVRYINRYYDGKASGFLLSISEKKRSGFQFNAKEIKRTLYRKEYQLRREQKARKTRTQEVIAERKHKKNLKTDYREAVRQGLIAAGVPGEKAETNTRFLSELVIKNCSHAAKSPEQVKESSIAAAVAVETKTKTPEKSKPKQQGKRK